MPNLDADTESRFVALMTNWLIALPHDLKILFDAAEDENLPREGRELAVGAIMHVVSKIDAVSDRNDGFASYADDCLILRLALLRLVEAKTEDTEYFESRYPEFFGGLVDELSLCKAVMGDVYGWIEGKVPGLAKLEHNLKKVGIYLDNDEASTSLYDDGLAFRTEYPVDEDVISDRFKKASTVLDLMNRRRAEALRE